MMRRLFWMGLGAAVAVAALRRARRSLGPLADAAAPVTAFAGSVRETGREFRSTMAQHEAELRAAFVEEAGQPDRPRTDPRAPAPPSWARRTDDDDEPYSF